MEKELYSLLKENGKKLKYEIVEILSNNGNSIEFRDGFGVEEGNEIIGQEDKKFYSVCEAYEFLVKNDLIENV